MRRIQIRSILAICFLGVLNINTASGAEITLSSISIHWNQKSREVETYFSVSNRSQFDTELTCIIVFKSQTKGVNRQRGVQLPTLKKSSKRFFKITNPIGILLKNDYDDISLILYGKDYQGFIDKSSIQQTVRSRRIFDRGKILLEITEIESKGKSNQAEINKRVLHIGAAEDLNALLETEQFQNAGLGLSSLADNVLPSPVISATSGYNSIIINWNPVEGATGYNLYWHNVATVSKNSATKIKTVQPKFIHEQLVDAVPYYYMVTAEMAGLEGPQSNEVTATPQQHPQEFKDLAVWTKESLAVLFPKNEESIARSESQHFSILSQIPPPVPPVLNAKVGDGRTVLFWEQVSSASRYTLYWSKGKNPDLKSALKISSVNSGFEHTGLQNNQPYYYFLTASNSGGESSPSATIEATPQIPATADIPVEDLLETIHLDEFFTIVPDKTLLVTTGDAKKMAAAVLQRTKELQSLDITSSDKLIALLLTEGNSDAIANVLSDQLSKDPENLNVALKLSIIYRQQGNLNKALTVLNSSLPSISMDARSSLSQNLQIQVKKGKTTLTEKSDVAYLADEYAGLGNVLLQKQKYGDALSVFQSLHSLIGDFLMRKYYMGLSYQGMKQFNQARRLFVEQSQEEITKSRLLQVFDALTQLLVTRFELNVAQSTRDRYRELARQKNSDHENATIKTNLTLIEELLKKTRQVGISETADLEITLAEKFNYQNTQPGQSIYLDFKVINHSGRDSSIFNVHYSLQNREGLIFDIMDFDRFKSIKANQSLTWNKKVDLPVATFPGEYRVVATLEQISPLSEVKLDNNQVASDLAVSVVSPLSDLELRFSKDVELTEIHSGAVIPIELSISNVGFRGSPGFQIQYQLWHENGTVTGLNLRDRFEALPKGTKDRLHPQN
ncbi:MAG: tetratricopeptide repeat protein, partial [SAR324 cluster bacterium]|nr:tetratricopeptide repeat protein [SAR324 cluster bacterium]